jgi:hypothetical protein
MGPIVWMTEDYCFYIAYTCWIIVIINLLSTLHRFPLPALRLDSTEPNCASAGSVIAPYWFIVARRQCRLVSNETSS